MFGALTLTLRPHGITPLDAHTGRFWNGLVYYLLARIDAPLSGEWHDARNPKPFTVSTLQGATPTIRGKPCALPDHTYTLRITVLETRGWQILQESVAQLFRDGAPLYMQQYPFSLEAAAPTMATGSPITADALLQRLPAKNSITFDFLSPTAFKKDDVSLLFPQPWNVFGSLLRNWEAFAPLSPLHPELRTVLEHQIAVSKYQLETTYINAMGYHLKGFTGRVTYQLLCKDPTIARHLHALADFAEYAGVGMKTTQGMGQVRRLE